MGMGEWSSLFNSLTVIGYVIKIIWCVCFLEMGMSRNLCIPFLLKRWNRFNWPCIKSFARNAVSWCLSVLVFPVSSICRALNNFNRSSVFFVDDIAGWSGVIVLDTIFENNHDLATILGKLLISVEIQKHLNCYAESSGHLSKQWTYYLWAHSMLFLVMTLYHGTSSLLTSFDWLCLPFVMFLHFGTIVILNHAYDLLASLPLLFPSLSQH